MFLLLLFSLLVTSMLPDQVCVCVCVQRKSCDSACNQSAVIAHNSHAAHSPSPANRARAQVHCPWLAQFSLILQMCRSCCHMIQILCVSVCVCIICALQEMHWSMSMDNLAVTLPLAKSLIAEFTDVSFTKLLQYFTYNIVGLSKQFACPTGLLQSYMHPYMWLADKPSASGLYRLYTFSSTFYIQLTGNSWQSALHHIELCQVATAVIIAAAIYVYFGVIHKSQIFRFLQFHLQCSRSQLMACFSFCWN